MVSDLNRQARSCSNKTWSAGGCIVGLPPGVSYGVFVIVPCATETRRLFDNDEILAFVALEQIDGDTHSGYTSSYDYDSSICMVLVSHRNLWPWHIARHCDRKI